MTKINATPSLTYDDVLIKPGYSECLPSNTHLESRFSKNIPLNIPLASAAMDTVTEAPVAIAMAKEGGIGVIHKNLSIENQARDVEKVKKYEAGMVFDPITIGPEATLKSMVELTSMHKITGVPVVNKKQELVGIITSRDMEFEEDLTKKVSAVMTPKERLIAAYDTITMDEAKKLLHQQ